MRKEDLIAFAERDWVAAEAFKQRWLMSRRPLTPHEKLEIADGLRRHVQALRKDWPSAEDRRKDLESHTRVSEMLRSVKDTGR